MARRALSLLLAGMVAPLAFAVSGCGPLWAQDASAKKQYELAKYIPTGIHVDKEPIHAEDMELCKAYEANLNAFPEIKEPFVCERPIHPKFRYLRKPVWKDLDPRKYVDLLVEVSRAKYRRYARPYPFDVVAARKAIMGRIQRGSIRLKLAELDIVPAPHIANRGPDGIPEKVLRVERGDPHCGPADDKWRHFPPVREYYIVNDDMTKVEAFNTATATKDVFLYKGRVYFDDFLVTRAMDADSPNFDAPGKRQPVLNQDRYEVYVSKPYSDGVVSICRYRYVK